MCNESKSKIMGKTLEEKKLQQFGDKVVDLHRFLII